MLPTRFEAGKFKGEGFSKRKSQGVQDSLETFSRRIFDEFPHRNDDCAV